MKSKNYRMPDELITALKKCCDEKGFCESRFVRMAIIDRLKKFGYLEDKNALESSA